VEGASRNVVSLTTNPRNLRKITRNVEECFRTSPMKKEIEVGHRGGQKMGNPAAGNAVSCEEMKVGKETEFIVTKIISCDYDRVINGRAS